MTKPNEVTASNSHAAMAKEIVDLRTMLRTVLDESRKIVAFIPDREKVRFLGVLIDAENQIK